MDILKELKAARGGQSVRDPDTGANLGSLYDLAAAEITRLQTALRPFAKESDAWAETVSDSFRPGIVEPRQKIAHAKAEFSLGDLRRAKQILG